MVGGVTSPQAVFVSLSCAAVAVLGSFFSTTQQTEPGIASYGILAGAVCPEGSDASVCPAITCRGRVGVPAAADGSVLVETQAKFPGSNAAVCAFTGRHKGLCFFYSSGNKGLVVVVAFVC